MAVVAHIDERPWLEELNPEQRAAATHAGGQLLILAGAGTGKTTTLCARVASLVAEGVAAGADPAADVHAPRGAGDAHARARWPVPAGSARARRHVPLGRAPLRAPARGGARPAGRASGCSTRATPPTCSTSCARSRATRRPATRFPKKGTLLDIYSRTVNAQRPLSGVVAEHFPWCEEHLEAIGRAVPGVHGAQARPRRARPRRPAPLLAGADARRRHRAAHRRRRSTTCWSTSTRTSTGCRSTSSRAFAPRAAVTSPRSATTSRRSTPSARPRRAHILEFPERFPGTHDRDPRAQLPLRRSRCSTWPTRVAAQDAAGFPKRLRAEREGGARPRWCSAATKPHQADEVCDRVLRCARGGDALREQAVLARTAHDSDLLELELLRRRIPFVKYGGLRYLEAAHVKDFLALLRLADNPARRDGVVPRAAAARGRRPGAAPAARVDRLVLALRELARLSAWRGRSVPSCRRRAPSSPTRWSPRSRDATGAGAPGPRGRAAARRARAARRGALRGRRRCACRTSTSSSAAARRRRDLRTSSPSSCSTRRARAPTSRGRRTSTRTGSSSPRSTRPRGSSGQPCTCSRSTTATSPPHGRRHERVDRRGTAPVLRRRSRGRGARCTSTSPLRYYHRPQGRDDAHGYGKPSRFLTPGGAACATSLTSPTTRSTRTARRSSPGAASP